MRYTIWEVTPIEKTIQRKLSIGLLRTFGCIT